jgi:hypothetical protein
MLYSTYGKKMNNKKVKENQLLTIISSVIST